MGRRTGRPPLTATGGSRLTCLCKEIRTKCSSAFHPKEQHTFKTEWLKLTTRIFRRTAWSPGCPVVTLARGRRRRRRKPSGFYTGLEKHSKTCSHFLHVFVCAEHNLPVLVCGLTMFVLLAALQGTCLNDEGPTMLVKPSMNHFKAAANMQFFERL